MGAALLLVLAAAIGLLFARWHVVRVQAVDADKVFAAIHTGPDYRLSAKKRAELLADGLDAGVSERVCTGLDQLGLATLVAAVVLAWDASFLRHLLQAAGPDTRAVALFGTAMSVALVLGLALCACAWLEARK